MTTYPEAAARVELEVSTPNEQLFARLQGKYDITIHIAAGFAERAGEQETATQLGRLCRLLFLHRADRLNRVKEEVMQPGPARPPKPEDVEFEKRYELLAATETSNDGSMSLTTVALSSWAWKIRRGTIESVGSGGVAERATEVANKMAFRLAEEVRQLKVDVYHRHG